jgi:hypothetical protein
LNKIIISHITTSSFLQVVERKITGTDVIHITDSETSSNDLTRMKRTAAAATTTNTATTTSTAATTTDTTITFTGWAHPATLALRPFLIY